MEKAELLYDYIKAFDLNKRELTLMDKICFSQWYHDNIGSEDIIDVLYSVYDLKMAKSKKKQLVKFVLNSNNRFINLYYKYHITKTLNNITKEQLKVYLIGKINKYNWLSEYDLKKSFRKGSVRFAYRLKNGEKFVVDKKVASTVKGIILNNGLFPSVITVESGFRTFGENGNLDEYIENILDNLKSNQKVLTKWLLF